jgi:DNA repair protein RecO (recombination protein O)
MEWSDDAIVLALRPHGETAAILEVLTREHGRHLGLVYGGASSKRRAFLQPGNRIHATWRARIPEHLGTMTAETVRLRAGDMFETRAALIGLNAFTAVAAAVLPEREPHRAAFEGADHLLEAIASEEFDSWGPLFVRWEMGLLDELGFGLDLSACAATGISENLVYVSPKSGRAVSKAAGTPYKERLLSLPAFLRGELEYLPKLREIAEGLKLTGYFLVHRVLDPHGKSMPEARVRLADMAANNAESVAAGESD